MSTGRFRSNGAVPEVLVHFVEALSIARKFRSRPRAWVRARSRSPSSSARRPSPEPEHVRRVDAELRDFAAFVETATKCLATDRSSPPRPATDPGARSSGVRHRLQSREGLGRHDERGLRGSRSRTASAKSLPIDVGNEPERHGAVAVVSERFVGHDRSQVGAAYADVDDVPDPLARVAFQVPSRTRSAKSLILSSTACYLGHDVLAIPRRSSPLAGHAAPRAGRHASRDVDLVA